MTCFVTKRKSTAYLDGTLRERDRSKVAAHLLRCDPCTSYFDEIASVQNGLRTLANTQLPSDLTTRLRVMASQERRTVTENGGSRLNFLWEKWRFRLNEFMRPLTIPATGGLLSSLLLFSSFLFTFTADPGTPAVSYEVPVIYQTSPDANLVPIQIRSSVSLTMSLDNSGRIRDYAVHDGSASFTGDASRLVNNNISMPRFPSVLSFAHPVTSDISIVLTPIVFRQ